MTRKPRFELFAASCAPDGGIYRYVMSDDGKLSLLGRVAMDRPMYFQKVGDRLHVILRAPDGFDGKSAYVCCNADGEAADMRKTNITRSLSATCMIGNKAQLLTAPHLKNTDAILTALRNVQSLSVG